MTRLNMIYVALGSAALTAAWLPSAQAQSGHALVLAENTCLERGITPHTVAFNSCVTRTARAYERGDSTTPRSEATSTAIARDTCLSYGLNPQTLGYRQCVVDKVGERPSPLRPPQGMKTIQTYRVHPLPAYPAYDEEYVVTPTPQRVSW